MTLIKELFYEKVQSSDIHILPILKQHELADAELPREHGIKTAVIYRQRSTSFGMDATLTKDIKELRAGKAVIPSCRRGIEMAKKVVERVQVSIRSACVAFGISEICYRYEP